MIALEKHIEILLIDHDCVIVPDLGGFVAHRVPARYVKDDGLFLPPLRTLGFNQQLRINDSLLAQSYIEVYDISYPEALKRIEEEVAELKQHLAINGEYELEDIGILSLNSEGQYLFEPCEAGLLTPSLYALNSFAINTIEEQVHLSATADEMQAQNSSIAILQNEPLIQDGAQDEDEEDDAKVIKIRTSWLRNCVAIAATLLAFFYVTPPVSNGSFENFDDGMVKNASVLSFMMPEMSEAKDADTQKHQVEKLSTAMADGNLADVAVVYDHSSNMPTNNDSSVAAETDDFRYCIVLASMISDKNAKRYVGELQAKGFAEARQYLKNDTMRVIYGSYHTITDAYNALNKLRDNADFEQAWVYKKR